MERAHRDTGTTKRRSRATSRDAIALLKADHRQVEQSFARFKRTRSGDRKGELAVRICNALKLHMTIEEEIFYPAFLAATDHRDKHHEAEVEHAGARRLVAEIEALRPGDEYFDAKVSVLAEMIRHHVKEEEKPGGMFAGARKSGMDLDELGVRLAARKRELGDGSSVALRGIGKSVLDA